MRDIPNGDIWNVPDHITLDPNTRLIAVRAINLGTQYCGGILASVDDNYLITNNRFKCTPTNPLNWEQLGYDDSSWQDAYEYGDNENGHWYCSNQQDVADINPSAAWIWTSDVYGDLIVCCRGYTPLCETASPCQNNGICLRNDVRLCNCPPAFTGQFCENAVCDALSPCQNGGTCNINNSPVCSCLPGFTGYFCETELLIRLTITAKSTLYEVFIDGTSVPLLHGSNVSYPDEIVLLPHDQLIAVTGIDTTGTCAGIIASVTDDIFVTNASWKCTTNPPPAWYTLGFDDDGWTDAYVIGPNHNVTSPAPCSALNGIPSISPNASWIWTPSILGTPLYDDIIFCRAYLPTCDQPSVCQHGGYCNRNNVTLCSCLPGYDGIFCENELERTLNITAKSVIYELYIDGISQNLTYSDDWRSAEHISLSSTNRLIAILAADSSEACAGILASVTDNVVVSDNTWKCDVGPPPRWYQFGFDDSDWPFAYVIGPNGGVTTPEACRTSLAEIPSISSDANWIWTPTIQDTPYYDHVVYCRTYLPICETAQPCHNGGTCNRNNETLCSCPDGFSGVYCEFVL